MPFPAEALGFQLAAPSTWSLLAAPSTWSVFISLSPGKGLKPSHMALKTGSPLPAGPPPRARGQHQHAYRGHTLATQRPQRWGPAAPPSVAPAVILDQVQSPPSLPRARRGSPLAVDPHSAPETRSTCADQGPKPRPRRGGSAYVCSRLTCRIARPQRWGGSGSRASSAHAV